MIREWWADQAQIVWAGVALTLFLGLFIGMLFWVFRPGGKDQYRDRARMPLDDEPGSRRSLS